MSKYKLYLSSGEELLRGLKQEYQSLEAEKMEEDNDTEVYSIVGSKEADPFQNKISNESPIAKAILGLSVGDIAHVDSPNGKYSVKVVEIF